VEGGRRREGGGGRAEEGGRRREGGGGRAEEGGRSRRNEVSEMHSQQQLAIVNGAHLLGYSMTTVQLPSPSSHSSSLCICTSPGSSTSVPSLSAVVSQAGRFALLLRVRVLPTLASRASIRRCLSTSCSAGEVKCFAADWVHACAEWQELQPQQLGFAAGWMHACAKWQELQPQQLGRRWKLVSTERVLGDAAPIGSMLQDRHS
jgi:hypothetical protein